jgi:hypothetical protein
MYHQASVLGNYCCETRQFCGVMDKRRYLSSKSHHLKCLTCKKLVLRYGIFPAIPNLGSLVCLFERKIAACEIGAQLE